MKNIFSRTSLTGPNAISPFSSVLSMRLLDIKTLEWFCSAGFLSSLIAPSSFSSISWKILLSLYWAKRLEPHLSPTWVHLSSLFFWQWAMRTFFFNLFSLHVAAGEEELEVLVSAPPASAKGENHQGGGALWIETTLKYPSPQVKWSQDILLYRACCFLWEGVQKVQKSQFSQQKRYDAQSTQLEHVDLHTTTPQKLSV